MFPLVFGSIFLLTGLVPIWLAARTFAKDRDRPLAPRAGHGDEGERDVA